MIEAHDRKQHEVNAIAQFTSQPTPPRKRSYWENRPMSGRNRANVADNDSYPYSAELHNTIPILRPGINSRRTGVLSTSNPVRVDGPDFVPYPESTQGHCLRVSQLQSTPPVDAVGARGGPETGTTMRSVNTDKLNMAPLSTDSRADLLPATSPPYRGSRSTAVGRRFLLLKG